ncbi:hypothetical protein BC834DRAFT_925246 [Gloeopeniophorella convolvens]|nr:hypothetical protein BC834DRAFT_925246 [Gloeopeniophorella convolvens]
MSASSRAAPSPAPDSSSLHSASSAGSLDVVLSHSSRRAASFELQIKALEEKLSEDLSNCRAIESTLREAFNGIKRNYRRADKDALRQHVPHIDAELDRARGVLGELEARLPEIRTEAAQVRRAYDSGRDKAQLLVEDLRWLNRDFTSRWRTVVFTRTSPVSWRVRAMLRTLFVLALVLAAWGAWLALRGVYRAHRQRLVWGERLIS